MKVLSNVRLAFLACRRASSCRRTRMDNFERADSLLEPVASWGERDLIIEYRRIRNNDASNAGTWLLFVGLWATREHVRVDCLSKGATGDSRDNVGLFLFAGGDSLEHDLDSIFHGGSGWSSCSDASIGFLSVSLSLRVHGALPQSRTRDPVVPAATPRRRNETAERATAL
jgi:hypothetical protein